MIRLRGLPRFNVLSLTLSSRSITCSLSLPLAGVVQLALVYSTTFSQRVNENTFTFATIGYV
ncbi:MAG: hypothetical protein V7L21_23050 [Nostoc sp.]|uniref:hypothetical protein n=1 Tax=unclassified Nostoc TaxID=2593658 RepID=UPI0025FD65A9|nr:hypothetical protein [Nostoc sp. NMS9]